MEPFIFRAGTDIYAVKTCDGSLVWEKHLEELTGLNATGFPVGVNWTVSRATPTIADDLLIIGIVGPAIVIAVKRLTGELVWSTQLDDHPAGIITMSGTYYKGLVHSHFSFKYSDSIFVFYACLDISLKILFSKSSEKQILKNYPMGIVEQSWGLSKNFKNNIYLIPMLKEIMNRLKKHRQFTS